MVVVIVGDFERGRAKALLEKHFAVSGEGKGKALTKESAPADEDG